MYIYICTQCIKIKNTHFSLVYFRGTWETRHLYVHKALCVLGDNILNYIGVSHVTHNEEDHISLACIGLLLAQKTILVLLKMDSKLCFPSHTCSQ